MNEGIYEQLINKKLESQLVKLEKLEVQKEKIDEGEATTILSKYIGSVVSDALKYIRDKKGTNLEGTKEALLHQIGLCNQIIELMSEVTNEDELIQYKISQQSEILLSIYTKLNSIYSIDGNLYPVRPQTSIAESSLFTGSTREPSLMSEIKKEIISSDSIDMLISFIKWSGLRHIYDELKSFVEKDIRDNARKVRIITTCYMGATDYGAVEKLALLPNVEIKISYDTNRTRLHAKSYVFHRNTGFTTAYIGSSNMSKVAMTSGLEWNLKVSEKDSFDIVRKFNATFNSYWNSTEFETFNPGDENNVLKLRSSLRKERNVEENTDAIAYFDIKPYSYQQEILDNLKAEREIFNRCNNLVVAATGVGKTVISAFDFLNYKKQNPSARLLFVAHREEIVQQSLGTFRGILKDNNFGSLFTGTIRPDSIEHLFITIQTFNSQKLITKTTKDFYDYIIVDEFHHAAAKSYKELLDFYKPKILLGLTATPERMDGKNILQYFDDYIASEMRLTEAIDHKLLSPFHYFCISDEVDLSTVKWSQGGYNIADLTQKYITNHNRRMKLILSSMKKYLTSIEEVKGLGFCVSVEHAHYMAEGFNKVGISSIVVEGKTDKKIRRSIKDKLATGKISFIFTVDVYNEGVDIPEVNTVLFLRPTQSLTVFLQQLGRGLRLHDEKDCLTVLDFVGQAHNNYNYEEKFRALLHHSRKSVEQSINDDTLSLPRGCYIKMEKLAKDYILNNLKRATNNKNNLIKRMSTFTQETGKELTLNNFLEYYKISITEFYGKNCNRSFYTLKCQVYGNKIDPSYSISLVKKYKNLFYLDNRKLINEGINYFSNSNYIMVNKKIEGILYYSFYNNVPQQEGFKSFKEALDAIKDNSLICEEVLEILKYQYRHIHFIDSHQLLNIDTPIDVHCTYTRDQLLAGVGYYNEESKPSFREGVLYLKEEKTDLFLITLNKSDKYFSEATMYEDYPINEILFHWQSQNNVSIESKTAKRYISHKHNNNDILLFVREYSKRDGFASPYIFLGKANYVSHKGSRPVSFVWQLETKMPASFLTSNLNLAR